MRPLIIGPDEQAAIAKVVDYAMEPDHFFWDGKGTIPGEDPNFVVHVPMGFRCVFTCTKHEGKLFRHLTVSVPDKGRKPSPEAMIMLAKEFGFSASHDNFDLSDCLHQDHWIISMGHEGENCIMVAQAMEQVGEIKSGRENDGDREKRQAG